jgi:hypothetical protein
MCLISTGCDPLTGGCGTAPRNCDDGLFCTIDRCDDLNGCVHTTDDSLCIDTNPCTNASYCNATTGCQIKLRNNCSTDRYCESFECLDNFGCSSTPKDCQGSYNRSNSSDSCDTYNCSEERGACELVVGVCFNFFGAVVGVVVGAIIGGVVAAAIFIAGISAGGVAAAISGSTYNEDDRAIKSNPLFQPLGKGAVGLAQ